MALEEDPPAGVPEWVVTYGDMMSLLLTFFIMLVSLSEINATEKYRAVLESFAKRMGYPLSHLAPEGKNFPLNSLVEELRTLGSRSETDHGRGGVNAKGLSGEDNRVFRQRDGIPIRDHVVQFESGKTAISEAQAAILQESADRLAGKPQKIEIRGHATEGDETADGVTPDARRIAYERARLVSERLVELGVVRDRLKICSVGDLNLSENGGDDLREQTGDIVEILVLDSYAEDFRGERLNTK